MKSKITNVIVFAVGAAIGSVVTWKVLEAKYEKLVQAEIESIRETFGEEQPEEEDDESDTGSDGSFKQINWEDLEDLDEEDDDDTVDQTEYERLTRNYTNEKGGAEMPRASQPYVIAPEDFGEFDDYHQIELTYYADGILEDAEGNIVTDVDELIGEKSLYTFGEYEEDAVHVRNDYLQTDFEILRDTKTYSEARSISPKRVGDG